MDTNTIKWDDLLEHIINWDVKTNTPPIEESTDSLRKSEESQIVELVKSKTADSEEIITTTISKWWNRSLNKNQSIKAKWIDLVGKMVKKNNENGENKILFFSEVFISTTSTQSIKKSNCKSTW